MADTVSDIVDVSGPMSAFAKKDTKIQTLTSCMIEAKTCHLPRQFSVKDDGNDR